MFAPYQVLGIAAALLLLVDLGAVYTLSEAPHPEIQFKAIEGNIIAKKFSPDQSPAKILSDPTLILKGSKSAITLQVSDFMEEPDFLKSVDDLQAFFSRQQTITNILREDAYDVVDQMGTTLQGSVTNAYQVSLPLMFWLQLMVGNIGFLVGVSLLAFQRNNVAAIHFCWTGVGLAIAATSAAIYSSRPISLDAQVFHILSSANHIGTMLFSAAFLSMVWHYPKALLNRQFSIWCYTATFSIFLFENIGWLDNLDITRRLPAVLVLSLSVLILIAQGYRSRNDPLQRQSMKWFVFITLSGSTFFVVMVMIPPLFGWPTSISQGAAFVAFLTIYLGLAVGISKYPLFDLDRYWVKTTYWGLFSLMLIGVDLLFVTVLDVSEKEALWLTLAVFGWIYFPLRSLADRIIFFRNSKKLEGHMPDIISAIARSDSHNTLITAWEDQLAITFEPLEIQNLALPLSTSTVVKRGLGMVVPGIDGKNSYLLEHANMGRRLFSTTDTELIHTLQGVFNLAHRARTAHGEGIQEERSRIKKDIHDSLGGRLLTILHRAKDPRIVSESRQAMNELRDILAAVEDQNSLLRTTLNNWQDQVKRQLDTFGVKFNWRIGDNILAREWKIEGRTRLNLGRVLTEATTNVIRHANAKSISIVFWIAENTINLSIENDGLCNDPANWYAGNGLNNIRTRATDLNGEVEWTLTPTGKMRMTLQIPLKNNLS